MNIPRSTIVKGKSITAGQIAYESYCESEGRTPNWNKLKKSTKDSFEMAAYTVLKKFGA